MRQLFLFLLFSPFASGQYRLSTETEVGTDGSGNNFASQYVFQSYNRQGRVIGVSSLARYFYVGNSVNRGEIAAGPNLRFEKGAIDTYVGGTTDKRLLVAAVGVLFLPKRVTAVVISDPKVTLDGSHSGTWFRKVWLGRGYLHLRWEDLYVERVGVVFGRMGAEARIRPFNKSCELFVSPFYDYVNGKTAVQGGVRVTLR